jgi:hypothetical protein
MHKLEKNVGKQFYLQYPQKIQILRNKLNKICKWPLQGDLQTTEGRNWKRLQKVERSPMLMGWKNQHSKNGYTSKSNLHVQSNFHQNSNDINHRDWKIYPNVHLETQKSVNSQDNTEQKE